MTPSEIPAPGSETRESSGDAGRVAVVTGGEGTLGKALAEALRASGRFAKVLAPGRGDLDVTDAETVKNFLGGLERLDLLVNNAGTHRDVPVLKMTEADWDRVVDTNLKGTFLCSREAARKMFRQRSVSRAIRLAR